MALTGADRARREGVIALRLLPSNAATTWLTGPTRLGTAYRQAACCFSALPTTLLQRPEWLVRPSLGLYARAISLLTSLLPDCGPGHPPHRRVQVGIHYGTHTL